MRDDARCPVLLAFRCSCRVERPAGLRAGHVPQSITVRSTIDPKESFNGTAWARGLARSLSRRSPESASKRNVCPIQKGIRWVPGTPMWTQWRSKMQRQNFVGRPQQAVPLWADRTFAVRYEARNQVPNPSNTPWTLGRQRRFGEQHVLGGTPDVIGLFNRRPPTCNSRPHALPEHLLDGLPVLMAEGGQTPGFEEQLIVLAQPTAGLHQFFLEKAAIEAHLLEHLLAELHHLPALIHHHISSFFPGRGEV